ncbi:hypothetical protein ACHAWX_004992 [Stephanocyclus meneghinianus]
MKIEVYTRPGVIVTNNNDNGWFLVQTAQVTGQGKGLPTSLPDFTYPVAMPANSKQSFYVTSSDGAGDVWYGLGQQLGQAYATDDNLSLLEGYSVSYRFVASSGPRRWNGNVRYSLSGESTQLPTVKPTAKPTSASTIPPSPKVCQYPTTYPTLKPLTNTPEPTSNPTTRPTLKPSLSPTQNNTAKPVTIPPVFDPRIGNEPTRSPLADATSLPSEAPTNKPSAKNTSKAPTPQPSSSSSTYKVWSSLVVALSAITLWSTMWTPVFE